MLCLSLNEDGLLTYSSVFFLNFFSPNFVGSSKFFPKNICKFWTKKSCDKDDFHPCRDAALLYSPIYGPYCLVFTWYSEIFWNKRQLLAQEQTNLFVSNCYCLLRWTKYEIPLVSLQKNFICKIYVWDQITCQSRVSSNNYRLTFN